MTSDIVAANSSLFVRDSWPRRIVIVAILIALADWLFFRQDVGVSLALFVLTLGAAVLLTNRVDASRRQVLLYVSILLAALLPSVEDFNVMSALIGALGTGYFTLGVRTDLKGDLKERFIAVGSFLVSGPFRFVGDLPVFREWASQRKTLNVVKGWILPLAMATIFVALFAAANPVIANWLAQWNVGDSIRRLDVQRLLLWLATTIAIWAFVCVSGRASLADSGKPAIQGGAQRANHLRSPPLTWSSLIFNDAAVVRSLVMFNLLFTVQTFMDINYLWRGSALPDGMSYASYAHRGAYPLVVTALLAAAFVIVAMRPGSSAERSSPMRALVFLWVGQNVLLVVSSILRLDLYVATYLLTYWRLAAFIWMLIVAAGLVLIVVRIVTYRSNAWLISANLAVLALTIYVCSFLNFASFIASYNVDHNRDSATAGRPIDLSYLVALGPQAIPALDRYIAVYAGPKPTYFLNCRDQLAAAHQKGSASWRSWTFRGWRLTRYLEGPKHTLP